MSADNWGVCPKCYEKESASHAKRVAAPINAYGKVSQKEYLRILEQAEYPITNEQTLREDYEIGVDKTGEFYVIYGCSCACGFKFEYKHKQQINL